MDTHSILILGHIIGTILGVGGATFIEIHLNMSLKDGTMDDSEKRFMAKDFLMTRIGMAIAFITGFGFLIDAYFHNALPRILADGVFWAKMAIIVIIIVNAYLLHKHKIGLYWGSAFSFVSWWTAMILGSFLTSNIKFFPANIPVSFVSIMAVYALCVIVGAFILHKIRTPRPINLTPAS
jgi:membrane protein YdbS with pleckstrin-like domain